MANPKTKTTIREGSILTVYEVHEQPVIRVVTHSIAEIQAKIAKIDSVIALWEAKKAPFQATLDEYNGLREGEERVEVEEIMDPEEIERI